MSVVSPDAGKNKTSEATAGARSPVVVDAQFERVFTSYCIITFHAADEEEASRMLYEAEDALNERPGVDAVLDDECYEWVDTNRPDEQWLPVRAVEDSA